MHALTDGLVVDVEWTGVLRPPASPMLLGSGEQGFDGFIAENEQRRNGSGPLGNGFVSCGLADAADDLFSAELFQIVGGTTGAVLGGALPAQPVYLFRQLGGGEPLGKRGERQHGLGNPTHARFIEVDPTHLGLAHLRRSWKLLQSLLRDEAWIDARECIHKTLKDALQTGNDLGKLLQRSSTVQLLGVVSHRLNAKHAFAFGIDLQSQLAAVQLEDRQIIRRSLDRDFPRGGVPFPFVIFPTMPVSEDGPDGLQVQRRAAAVNQRLKHLLHLSADFEDQIPAVLDLIVRVLIIKPAPLLFLQIEGKAQAGAIDPTLADLVQPPYSPGLGQGICDLRQACGVGDMSKTVSFLRKANSCPVRLTGYVLVPVQDDLRGEGGMPADLDGDMAPFRIQDMKGIVVHVGHGLFTFEMMGPGDLPYRSLGATDQDEKQSLSDAGLGQIFLCEVVFPFPRAAVDDRNSMRLGVGAKAPTEATRHPHQMRVVQRVVGSGQGPPPDMKASGRMAHTEVGIQNDPIHTIVAAGEKILIMVAESIRHGEEDYRHSLR